MLWMYDNKADSGTWTSVNTSDPYYPPANLQNFLMAKVWRSGVAVATERLVLDLGAATAPGVKWYLNLGGHNFNSICSGAASILVEGHTSNSWGTPTFSTTIPAAQWGVNAATGNGVAFLEISSTYAGLRWWRISMVKNNATDLLQIGRASIGPGVDTGVVGDPDLNSVARAFAELANKDVSIGGQVYAEQRAQFIRLKGKISATPEATAALLRVIWPTIGTWKPFFLQMVPADWPTGTLSLSYYVRLATNIEEQVAAYGAGYLWNIPLSFEEQL